MGVFKRRHRNKAGQVVESRFWWGRYRIAGDITAKTVALGCRDKQTAEQKLRDIVVQAERERAGLALPVVQKKCLAKSLASLIDEFIGNKEQVGRAEDYTRIMAGRLNTLAQECHWRTLADITAQSFLDWRRGRKECPKTLNEYLGSVKRLLVWVRKNYGLPIAALDGVEYIDERGQETFERRALTLQEAQRLLDVAPPDRRLIYILALSTGLRRAEMESLRWGEIDLDAEKPFLRVRARYTKNKQDAFIPLIAQTVEVLRSVRPPEVAGDALVLVDGVPRNRRALRRDMEAAGIPVMDANGRKFDLHALRTTCCTFLLAAGVAPRMVQEIMRHSDIRLTTKNYADMSRSPVRESMQMLAPLVTFSGTDRCTRNLTKKPGASGLLPSHRGNRAGNEKPAKHPENIGDFADCHVLSQDDKTLEMVEAEGLEPTTH